MLRKIINESSEPVVGRLGMDNMHSEGISYKPQAAKSRCARNWGGWGQLSVEGPGQNNPDRSEDPWGRATIVARMAALKRTTAPTPSGGKQVWKRGARKRDANQMGATIGRLAGKAPSDRPALKPYWGKPAVRNFRGGDGNVGIIRSPVRAIASPDITPTIHQPSPPALISEQPLHILGQVHVERVDFLEPRVPQEEWASIRGHSVVGPEAAGMQAASLL